MWSDNETSRDFLNFTLIADTAAEMIVQAQGRPLSLGVSGSWGVGKSSMLKLIQVALERKGQGKFLFVEFNAWLYQGYDDARAALMDVIARALIAHAEEKKTLVGKAKELLQRVDVVRVMRLVAPSAIATAFGLGPVGLVGEAAGMITRCLSGKADAAAIEGAMSTVEGVASTAQSLDKGMASISPPREIQELRKHFEDTLGELDVRLVVLVDDLDRCLPQTAIATLEAMRLFVFLKNTAFIIAADEKVIRHAVRIHFQGLSGDSEEALVTNYFDKLIQVPIRVPPLGTQDVRAYLILLFIENSSLDAALKDELRHKVCKQLSETWQGKRVDRAFVASHIPTCPPALMARLEVADRLAPLMASVREIAGNPRLIKRFLNTLSIRVSVARQQGMNVDEAVLAKMMLFERCGDPEAYRKIVAAINNNEGGKPEFLRPLEKRATLDEPLEASPGWDTSFIRQWLAMPPSLADLDLRPVVYVSRDHMPLLMPADQMSAAATKVFSALLEIAEATPSKVLLEELLKLPKSDLVLMMDRLLARARQVQEWSQPPVLGACLTVAAADPEQAARLSTFLSNLPAKQLQAPIVPRLEIFAWAQGVFEMWMKDPDVPKAVSAAIREFRNNGGGNA